MAENHPVDINLFWAILEKNMCIFVDLNSKVGFELFDQQIDC